MMRKTAMQWLIAAAILVTLPAAALFAAGCGAGAVVIATTSEMAQSELYTKLVKEFEKQNGVKVRTKSYRNSVEVLSAGERGEADALLVSNKPALEKWLEEGYAASAEDVFYSDFIVVGPVNDPAQIKGLDCPGKSCKKVGTAGAAFVARGDGSDLDAKVMGYWNKCGIDPSGQGWFTKTGQDMPTTITIAGEKQAYTICDTSAWLENQADVPLTKLVEGCAMLMNQYCLVVIDPEAAVKLADFMIGETCQGLVGSYQESGVVIYHPNATKEI